ncbi:hypothetical protein [Roseibacillus ishigakijimensis]|uniref:Uncharacterized protein n=1 Tax=Roseibacillus ishigakijimensis TaxID=454146 RepID=A0A934RNA7_9BACT|nr:hypothetical protein [Roseibacillus ishigakijimensis]MBK1833935.1 hypothetical protein [Roseibacillus ishigakijimensis]
MTLRIECPDCRQDFEVSEELKGRMVECGSCESRFQVTPDVIANQRERFFPDEIRKNTDLSRFGRAPAKAAPVAFRTMEYSEPPKQPVVGPVPPIRVFAVVAGFFALVLTALFLYFGSQPGSTLLRDVERPDRLLLGGFAGLLGFFLLGWGAVRGRALGILVGALGLAGVMALAYLMPVHYSVRGVGERQAGTGALEEAADETGEREQAYFPGISDDSLSPQEIMEATRWEAMVLPHTVENESQVAAIWVREMKEFQSLQLEQYLKGEFDLPLSPEFRVLQDGGIFVMTGVPLDLERVEVAAGRIGEIEAVLPELRLIQVKVNPEVLGVASGALINQLNDATSERFFELNYAELVALDRTRVKSALDRLASVEPRQMRQDMTVRLVGLLGGSLSSEELGSLVKALGVWSQEGDGVDRLVVDNATRLREEGVAIPDDVMAFLAERKPESAAVLLIELWVEEPVSRQRFLENYGSGVAPLLVPFLRSSESALVRSAAHLLGQVGTAAQVPGMREMLGELSHEELRPVVERAIERASQR